MRAARSRRSRILLWVGVLLMVTGAGLLGYVGWQFWGTNWVAQREHAEITRTLADAVGGGGCAAGAQAGAEG